ncbi:10494_t:CDS:2 [Ambispora gerdemannii]|uniref:Transcription initiation factor IIE subunit beta n=1 Tax=Ambispora gerdemannii TaxID=144530 RepID=A0A9N8V3X2_9GLOM|nr:10494_t:CDS:2 [Ambispora gerdemannii]
MSFLSQQAAAFKSQIATQPVLPRPKISTAVSSSSSTNTNSGVPAKRAREDASAGIGVGAGGPKKKKPVFMHTLSKLHNVINFLKEHVDLPQTLNDFKEANIEIEKDPQLLSLMQNSEKILYDPVGDTYQYKASINAFSLAHLIIRDKEDLVKLLFERKDSKPCGMQFKDLADSYIDLKKAINELEEEKRILVIRSTKENAPRIIFWNSTEEDTQMDKEFVEIFHKVKVPEVQVDLPKELQKAGLQTMEVYENKTKTENKQKQRKKKQMNRKIKIHNTHVNIDLTKDYPHRG